MWFEGEVHVRDFANKIKENILAQGAWVEISSKPGGNDAAKPNGTDWDTDDGWVFHSLGSSLNDKIFVGMNPSYLSNNFSNWYQGHKFFIAEDYTPNITPGENGYFTNQIWEYLKVHSGNGHAEMYEDTATIKYAMSVTADRIIIAVRNPYYYNSYKIRNFIYLGLMKRYSEETDSTAAVIGAAQAINYNTYNSVRVLKDARLDMAQSYNVLNSEIVNNYSKAYGDKFKAINVPLGKSTEGLRGELDGVLCARFYNNIGAVGRTHSEEGRVMIDGKEYIVIHRPYAHLGHCNFSSLSTDFNFFIEVK